MVSPISNATPINQIPQSTIYVPVPSSENLTFIYVAIVREKLGSAEFFYEQTIENGTFEILLPRPHNPIESWTVMIHGYRNGDKVFYFEKKADSLFV